MDDKQRSNKARGILNDLDWLKSEALKRLNEGIPGLEVDSADVKEIGYSPSDKEYPVEDGDIILWMNLSVHIHNVSVKQMDKLLVVIGSVVINSINEEDIPVTYNITYNMFYNFTLWDNELEDDFR